MPRGSRKVRDLAVVKPTERSEGGLTTAAPLSGSSQIPNPEVSTKAVRRRYTVEYKLSILKQADACREPGEIGALLRREGLYSSLLTAWRRLRDAGLLAGSTRRRGPKSKKPDPRVVELERENRRLRRRLEKAEAIIDVQNKVSTLLGIPLNQPEHEEDD